MVHQRRNPPAILPLDAVIFLLPCLLTALLYVAYALNPVLYWQFVTPEHLNPGFPALEWFQFGAYLGAAILSYCTSIQLRSSELLAPRIVCIFISLGALFVALEEVSYGQHIFKLTLPGYLAELNSQGELTLHNLKLIQPSLHRVYTVFGLIGSIGWIARRGCLPFSVRDLLFIEFRFSLFFWPVAGYYFYLDQINQFASRHQEGPEGILACGVFLICLSRYRRSLHFRRGCATHLPPEEIPSPPAIVHTPPTFQLSESLRRA